MKSDSQPLPAVYYWKLAKFEERICKIVDEILLNLLFPWVKKTFSFYQLFIWCKTKKINLIVILLKFFYLKSSSPKWKRNSCHHNFHHLECEWKKNVLVTGYMFVSQLTLINGVTLIITIEFSKSLNHTYMSHLLYISSPQTIIHKAVLLGNFYAFH